MVVRMRRRRGQFDRRGIVVTQRQICGAGGAGADRCGGSNTLGGRLSFERVEKGNRGEPVVF
jgi:hypothetical protein